jgi:hypothetical protein
MKFKYIQFTTNQIEDLKAVVERERTERPPGVDDETWKSYQATMNDIYLALIHGNVEMDKLAHENHELRGKLTAYQMLEQKDERNKKS